MKKRKYIRLKSALGLIAVILIMLLIQAPAQGVVMNCTADADCDGFLDAEDNSLFHLGNGDPVSNPPMNDLNRPDLFVILLSCDDPYNNDPLGGTCTTGNSKLPADPLGMLSSSASNLGINGINVHRIYPYQTWSGTIRNVTATQKAVRILESKASSGVLGSCIPGTPNTTDDYCTVFTDKISSTVDTLCGSSGKPCKDADGIALDKTAVIAKYKRHTISHEIGHVMTLRAASATDIGQHYPQINVILDSSVLVVNSGGGKKFYIGSQYYTGTEAQYTPNDRDSARLR